MYKKWKSVAALGMAVLIGCMMPVDTMIVAAEENPEAAQEIEVDSVSDEEAILDGENAGDEISADEAEYVDEEVNTDNSGIAVMAETEETEETEESKAGDIETQASAAAPVIEIKWQGQSYICSLGGKIDFVYDNNGGQAFECSASQAVLLFYCLEKVDANAEAKGDVQMDSLIWQSAQPSLERIPLSDDAHYVLYVKAEGTDRQTTYARSGGVVVDTIAPGVTKLVDGGTYPEGTTFQVSEANLESVKVNEVLVNPESDGSYRLSANGTSTSCVVRVRDKAGNETTYSITISKDPSEDGIISENGTYSLKANVKYQLGAGKWQVSGDKSVYSGGSTFYVKKDGDYTFTKR